MVVADLGKVYLRFADIRDAEKAIIWVSTFGHRWNAQYTAPNEFSTIRERDPTKPFAISMFEGQVIVTATFAQSPRHIDVDATGKFISELASDYGNVMAFEVRPGRAVEVLYHMEFCDLHASDKALADLHDLKFDVSLRPAPSDTCRKLTHTDVYLDYCPSPA